MAEGGVWADPERARQVVDEVKTLKSWLEPYNALRKRLDDARGLAELADAEPDEALARDLDTEAAQIVGDLERLELRNMMRGGDDARDALLTIHPGAGSTATRPPRPCASPTCRRTSSCRASRSAASSRTRRPRSRCSRPACTSARWPSARPRRRKWTSRRPTFRGATRSAPTCSSRIRW